MNTKDCCLREEVWYGWEYEWQAIQLPAVCHEDSERSADVEHAAHDLHHSPEPVQYPRITVLTTTANILMKCT